jgi:PAS domain S-box-containing protein
MPSMGGFDLATLLQQREKTRSTPLIFLTATDPLWENYRELALSHGLRACWSTPILDDQQRVLGTFAIYYRQPGPPNERHRRCVDMATHLAATAIERHRDEAALRAKTEELERYFTNSLDLLCIADTDGFFRRLIPEWERTLGYPLAELEGRRFLDFIHPDDMGATLAALHKLSSREHVLNFVNRYRHQDGSYPWIEWRSYAEDHVQKSNAKSTNRWPASASARGIATRSNHESFFILGRSAPRRRMAAARRRILTQRLADGGPRGAHHAG